MNLNEPALSRPCGLKPAWRNRALAKPHRRRTLVDVDKTQQTSLKIAVALPLVFIAIVAVLTWVPSMFIETQYDFIYQYPGNYYYPYRDKEYDVQNGRVVLLPSDDENEVNTPTNFYVFDTSKNSASPLSFEEVQKFEIISRTTSPDGYEIATDSYRSGGIIDDILFDTSTRSVRLKKGAASKKLNIDSGSRYLYNFRFVGWINPLES